MADAPDVPTACRMCRSRALQPAVTVRGYTYLQCDDCGFLFTPAVAPAQTQAMYREGGRGLDGGAPPHGWANLRFLQPALRTLHADARPLHILDFGAGDSALPDRLRQRGHRVVAIDLAPPRQPHPDRWTGDLLEMDLTPDTFDLAYAFQVFEHLPEPRPYLEALVHLTRPGGQLVIHTDMATPERAAGLDQWWYLDPPDHCSIYCHRAFEMALGDTPHRIVRRTPKSVTIEVGAET